MAQRAGQTARSTVREAQVRGLHPRMGRVCHRAPEDSPAAASWGRVGTHARRRTARVGAEAWATVVCSAILAGDGETLRSS